MEAANLLNFHPLGRSKSYHGGFIKNYMLLHEKIVSLPFYFHRYPVGIIFKLH
jgi:hypothetical protein